MRPSRDSVEEVVLKTVAFQKAIGTYPPHSSLNTQTDTARKAQSRPSPLRASLLQSLPVLLRTMSDTVPAPSPHQHTTTAAPPAATPPSPSFTFHVPTSSVQPSQLSLNQRRSFSSSVLAAAAAAAPPPQPPRVDASSASPNHSQTAAVVASSSLHAALQQHEASLRSWADEPVRRVSASQGMPAEQQPHLPSSPLPLHPSPSLAHPSMTPHAHEMRAGATNLAAQAAPEFQRPSRVTLAATRPHCRVLAKDSMARIGLPWQLNTTAAKVLSSNGADAYPSVPLSRPSLLQREPQLGGAAREQPSTDAGTDEGYAASQSSVSDTAQRLSKEAKSDNEPPGEPLLPYQLLLHMSWDTPNADPATVTSHAGAVPLPSAASLSPVSETEESSLRRTLLREQAQRYDGWRSRQAAVLQQLAPDMWGRSLPPYISLDRAPQVMDAGLQTFSSTVRQARYDSGVVYV